MTNERPGGLGSLFKLLRPRNYRRAHPRYEVCIPATMRLTGRGYEITGLVMEISVAGLLFREASDFILDRTGHAVTVRFQEFDLAGQIVSAHRFGYGVRLVTQLEEDTVQDLVAGYGLDSEARAVLTDH